MGPIATMLTSAENQDGAGQRKNKQTSRRSGRQSSYPCLTEGRSSEEEKGRASELRMICYAHAMRGSSGAPLAGCFSNLPLHLLPCMARSCGSVSLFALAFSLGSRFFSTKANLDSPVQLLRLAFVRRFFCVLLANLARDGTHSHLFILIQSRQRGSVPNGREAAHSSSQTGKTFVRACCGQCHRLRFHVRMRKRCKHRSRRWRLSFRWRRYVHVMVQPRADTMGERQS